MRLPSSVISTVANQIKSGSLDLSNSTQLQAIIQSATSQLQAPQVSSIASDAAKLLPREISELVRSHPAIPRPQMPRQKSPASKKLHKEK